MRNSILLAVVLLVCCGAFADVVYDRQNTTMLYQYNTQKYPPVEPRGNVVRAYCIFALASRGFSQITAADIEQANQLIIDTQQGWPVDDEIGGTYWMLSHLGMIGCDAALSSYLTPQAKEALYTMLYDYSKKYDLLADIYPIAPNIWRLNKSDNHNIVRKAIYYCTSMLMKDDPQWQGRLYNDGTTAQQHYDALTEFLPEYFRQAAMNGVQVEFASPTYSGLYLMATFTIRDCTDSALIRSIASKYLDLYFTDVAIETLNGIRGGAAVRSYKDASSYNFKAGKLSYYNWLFSGLPADPTFTSGNSPFDLIPGCITDYRLPTPTLNLYTDTQSRGDFEYVSSRPGRGTWVHPTGGELWYTVEFPAAIRRSTYITPAFTIGTFTLNESLGYTQIINQNHWMGVIGGDNYSSRVYMQAEGRSYDTRTGYQDLQAVGSKGAAIIRRNINISEGYRRLQIFFSQTFGYNYDGSGWLFAQNSNSTAYVAVRAVHKTESPAYSFAYDSVAKGDWVTIGNLGANIIIDVRKASEYANFQSFKADVLDNSIIWSQTGDSLTYTSCYGDAITMYNDARLPLINAETVDLNPPQVYSSPYLQADAGSSLVTINDQYGNEKVLNFGYCNYYNPGDLNLDCYVDIIDLSILASQWMQCTDPTNEDCF